MNTQNTFSLRRLAKLITNDLRIHSKTILIVTATLVVLYALMPFQVTASFQGYFLILYIGGFIVTSYAFKDLHERNRAHLYLTLPVSNLERFLSKWLLTSIIFALGTLIMFYLFALLSVVVNLVVYKQQIFMPNLLQADLWIGIGKYFILQAIVLLGAIIFKKHALIKIVLAMGCLMILVTIISLLLAYMFCPNCSRGLFMLHVTFSDAHFLFWTILAPICWYITYLRVTEYELK